MNNELLKIIKSIILEGLEPFGKYYSSYRAFVYNREDPLNCNRLQLIIPNVGGDKPYLYWALPSNNFSGKGYGCQVLPSEKDLVWVEFEMGNPKRPIWKFGYFGEGEKPKDLISPDNYWFKTPKGNLVEFNDTKGKEFIRMTSSKGQIIEMSDVINLGGDKEDKEPALLGDKSYTLLKKILEGLEAAKVNTAYGPQPLMNLTTFTQLREEDLETIRSENVNLIP